MMRTQKDLNPSRISSQTPGPTPARPNQHEEPRRRNLSTEAQYTKIALQIERLAALAKYPYAQFEEGFLDTVQCSATEILAEFKRWSMNKQRATFDSYRAALLWAFHQGIFSDRPDARDCYLELSQIKSDKPPSGKSTRDRSRRLSIPKADMTRLILELLDRNKSSNLGVKTQDWLLAGVATSLRPNEWEFAELISFEIQPGEKRHILKVRNSKIKSAIPVSMQLDAARLEFPLEEINTIYDTDDLDASVITTEAPEFRHIPVDKSDAHWVQSHLDSIREHLESGRPFRQYYDQCRQCLLRACKHVFKGKKFYSLYVLRHQFAANAKAKYSREEVAAMMGHTDVATANKDYASKRHAHRSKGGPKEQIQAAERSNSQTYFTPASEATNRPGEGQNN